MIGEVLINATAFVGGSFRAKYLSGDQKSVEEEKERHNVAVERYQVAYKKYQENRTYICMPQSVFLDQLLMFNLQMQFIKLIFFSFLIKSKSTSMDYQLFQRLFRQFMSVDH